MNKEQKNNIFQRFMCGESISEIAESFGLNWSNIYQTISSHLPTCMEFSIADKEKIKEMYLDGMSCPKIGELFKVNHKCIGNVLDEFGIKRKHNGIRKYTLRENYFDEIDTPNKAYILGLLYADGYNGLNKQTIRIQLSEEDLNILERINKELGSNRPIKKIDCSNRIYGNGYISKNMYSLEFYSHHICHVLDKVGMHQNKSLILEYPTCLSDELQRHFIRGYFDGDGSFYVWSKKDRAAMTITSTEMFCNDCLEIIRLNVDVGGNIYDASCHNGVTKVLSIGGNNQCKRVLDWLYHDAELFIKRKYDRYIKYYYSTAA